RQRITIGISDLSWTGQRIDVHQFIARGEDRHFGLLINQNMASSHGRGDGNSSMFQPETRREQPLTAFRLRSRRDNVVSCHDHASDSYSVRGTGRVLKHYYRIATRGSRSAGHDGGGLALANRGQVVSKPCLNLPNYLQLSRDLANVGRPQGVSVASR